MKPEPDKTPRSNRTLEYYFAAIMEMIVKLYLQCIPEHDRNYFMESIYEPLKAANVSGDTVLSNFFKAGGTNLGKGDATLLGCVYCIQSGWARIDGQMELAWSYLMEAQQYVAVAIAEDVSEPHLAKVLDLARTEAKRNAAQESVAVSVQPWRETKLEAMRLIQEEAQGGKRWISAEQAAVEILDDLKNFLKTRQSKKPKDFWAKMPEKTVAGWLREMPNASTLFRDDNSHIDANGKNNVY
jgi:hypothetical protein